VSTMASRAVETKRSAKKIAALRHHPVPLLFCGRLKPGVE
jgi:hypothetical protein